MNLNRYTAALAALLVLVTPAWPAAAQDRTPRVIAEETFHSVGRVPSDARFEHSFQLRNAGDAPLKIADVQLSGRGLRARLPGQIDPGASGEVTLLIDAENLIGDWEWRISFRTNDSTRRELSFTVSAVVFPPIEVAPGPVIYFSIFDDESATQRATIVNHTDQPLTIERMEILGQHFTAALGTVEAGKQYALDVTVPQSVPPGRYREGLVLHTNHPARPVIRVPVNVLVKTDIFIFPETVDFGRVEQRQIRNAPELRRLLTQSHTITHRAGEFAITDITTDIPFLTIDKSPAGRAEVFQLSVGLDMANIAPGVIDGAITLRTDDPRYPEITLPVSGEIR